MQLPKELTTVTTLSKTVAFVMFITLPLIAFFFGMRYQTIITEENYAHPPPLTTSPTIEPISCTMDAKVCPDGSAVGRVAPNCEFEKCPTVPQTPTFCGGIAGQTCPNGYYCKYDGSYPDAGGTCLKD